MTASFTEELPQLMTSTFGSDIRATRGRRYYTAWRGIPRTIRGAALRVTVLAAVCPSRSS